MIGIRDFVVHIPRKYNESYQTESGMKLYGDKRWSPKKLANNIAEVIEVPLEYDGPIKKGSKIFIDPSVVFNQTYNEVEAESPHLIDREKSLFKVDSRLIIMYYVGKDDQWKGYGDNTLLNRIFSAEIKNKSGIIIPEMVKPKFHKDKMEVVFDNDLLNEDGANIGDVVYINPQAVIDVYFESRQYVWLRNKHVLGVELKEVAA